MSHLRITCFNGFQATLDGQLITGFRSVKGRALLTYLAVEAGNNGARPQQRETLAGLLWPDEPEERARRNLSQTLLELRQTLRDRDRARPLLAATTQTLAFTSNSNAWVDVTAFTHHLAAVTKHPHADLLTCGTCTHELAQAVALYQGAFLHGFSVPDSDLFEQWVVTTREKLHQQALDAFTILSRCYQTQGDLAQALQTVRRLLELAPWQEEAHRQLMLLLALSGQRTQALAQFDRCTQILMDELGVPPAKETDALYDQILAGEIGPANRSIPLLVTPSAPAAAPPPFQVLIPPPHFVGRTAEIAQLTQGLTGPGPARYALVGMGGAGKTTLAIQVAHHVRDHFADGVLWANAAISEPLDILASWARAYGYDFSGLPDVASRAAAVRGVLAEKAVLIVLDNVLEASRVQPLLPGGDCNPVLLTTRDLDVAHALNAEALLLGELSAQSSRQLLAQILGEERVQAEEEAAAQISALLHYLPLAVEIVGQRLKSRPRQRLAQMAERLRDEAQRLGLEISDRAVRTSFEVSWQALDGALRRAFTLLAVFAGRPFTAAAVAHVAEAELEVVEERIFALEALSLVKAEGETHYRQHPLLADFAREKLADTGVAYGRMTDYYYHFVQKNQQNYAILEPEWGNMMAALETAYSQQRWQRVVDHTLTLTDPWFNQGRYTEARQAFGLTNAAIRQLNDEAQLAANLLRWGEACIEQNDYAEAKTHLAESLAITMRLENDAAIATAKYHLGRCAIEQNQYDEAERQLRECLSIREALGDLAGVAAGRYQQAVLAYSQDQFPEAQALAEQALAYQQTANDRRAMLPTLRLLAHIAMYTPTPCSADEYGQAALALSEALQDPGELAATLHTLTAVYRDQGDFDRARACAEKALPIFQRLGLRRTEGLLLYQLSLIYKELAEYPTALELMLRCITLLQDVQDHLYCAFALLRLGDLYQNLGQHEEGRNAWQAALQTGKALDHAWLLEELHQRLN